MGYEKQEWFPGVEGDTMVTADRLNHLETQYDEAMSNAAAVNVKEYGAKGDGETDDTQAIQSALDENQSVFLPLGKYVVSKYITMNEGNSLYGHGARLIRANGFFSSMLGNHVEGDHTTEGYEGNGNILVQGVEFDGEAEKKGSMVLFVHGHDITVRDCTFYRCVAWHPLEFNSSTRCIAENCRFLGYIRDEDESYRKEAIQIDTVTSGNYGAGDGTPARNITIRGCYFGPDDKGNPAQNVCVGGHVAPEDAYYENITITECVGEDLLIGGVWIIKAKNLVVTGNTFILNDDPEQHSNSDTYAYRRGVFTQESLNSLVSGNIIHCVDKTESKPHVGIELSRASTRSIVSNNIVEYGTRGIVIDDSDNVLVSGNTTRNTMSHAVRADKTTNCEILSNNFISPGYENSVGVINIAGTSDDSGYITSVIGNVSTPPAGGNSYGVSYSGVQSRTVIIANRFRDAEEVTNTGGVTEANTTS